MFLQFSGATVAGAEVLAGRCLPRPGTASDTLKPLTFWLNFQPKFVNCTFCSFSSKFPPNSGIFQPADFQAVEKCPIFGQNLFN